MFCLILSVFHFKTNYYLCVAVTLVAAVLYWAAESCWCLHVVFRVRRINWTKYKLMKNDSYAETNCTFTHHKGAPALVVCVCVCSLTVLGCVVQRDDTKPSFVSLLEDPLSVWLAALLFMRTCVHAYMRVTLVPLFGNTECFWPWRLDRGSPPFCCCEMGHCSADAAQGCDSNMRWKRITQIYAEYNTMFMVSW